MQMSKVGSATRSCNKSLRPRLEYAISLAQDRLYSKECQVVTFSGIAPNTPDTWKLLESKHPQGPTPIQPMLSAVPVSISHDLDIMAILRSFPNMTAVGPSGMRVQHLLDACGYSSIAYFHIIILAEYCKSSCCWQGTKGVVHLSFWSHFNSSIKE